MKHYHICTFCHTEFECANPKDLDQEQVICFECEFEVSHKEGIY